MANKAINDLLKYGIIELNETFTTTYVPANTSTLYSNVYNGWSIYDVVNDFNGTKGQFNGNSFYQSCGTNAAGRQMSKIFNDKEIFVLGRPIDVSFKYSNNLSTTQQYGNCYAELALYGNYAKTSLIPTANGDTETMNFGGVALSFSNASYYARTLDNSGDVRLLVNGSVVAFHHEVLSNSTTYYGFLKIRGNIIYYDWNTTGGEPAIYAHSYTASGGITSLSNRLMVATGSSASNNNNHYVLVDNLNIRLY